MEPSALRDCTETAIGGGFVKMTVYWPVEETLEADAVSDTGPVPVVPAVVRVSGTGRVAPGLMVTGLATVQPATITALLHVNCSVYVVGLVPVFRTANGRLNGELVYAFLVCVSGVTKTATGMVTVSGALPVTPPAVARMFAEPASTALTSPAGVVTVATRMSEDDQLTEGSFGTTLPSA